MANGLPIDEETFESLSPEKQNAAIYKVLVHMVGSGYECSTDREKFRKSCSDRMDKLEKRHWKDKGFASGMGLIGGFLASLFKGTP